MTEPDEALLWAREDFAKQFRSRRSHVADSILSGFWDIEVEVSLPAHGYRARAAASAERIKELEARVTAFEWALTPSAETKAAYIGEFKQVVGEENAAIIIEWTTVKEIMGAIRKLALLKESDQ